MSLLRTTKKIPIDAITLSAQLAQSSWQQCRLCWLRRHRWCWDIKHAGLWQRCCDQTSLFPRLNWWSDTHMSNDGGGLRLAECGFEEKKEWAWVTHGSCEWCAEYGFTALFPCTLLLSDFSYPRYESNLWLISAFCVLSSFQVTG